MGTNMKIKLKILFILWFEILILQGCSLATGNVHREAQYSYEVFQSNTIGGIKCNSINGIYKNSGTGKREGSEESIQLRLDALLGHTTPATELPELVELELNSDNSILKILFGAPLNLAMPENVKCIGGWYEFQKFRKGEYVGDGGSFKGMIRTVQLAKSPSSSLLINILLIESSNENLDVEKDRGEIFRAEFEPVK
jgi:hypothetical protein